MLGKDFRVGAFMPRRSARPLTPFAVRLKTLREAAGLTQQQLARRAGLHLGSLFKIEQGLREPLWDTVCKLADALDVTVTEFVEQPSKVVGSSSDAAPTLKKNRARRKAT
jgi:transcriptional regulator with XRE-family HTH domain